MRAILFLSAVLISLWPAAADAQVFGTFTWQMQPYCNRVTLMLATSPGGFSVSGVDDQCGAVSKGSATGVAVFNGDGSVGLNFTIVTPPSGVAVHVSATVSPATGQGTWSDDVGNTGTLALHGNVSGLPARPSGGNVLVHKAEMVDDRCRRRFGSVGLTEHDEDTGKLDQRQRTVCHQSATEHRRPERFLRLDVLDRQMNVSQRHAKIVCGRKLC